MAGEIRRATCFCIAYGQSCNIVPHFLVFDIANDYPAIIAELRANFLTYLLPLQYTSAVWNRVDIKNMNIPAQSTFSQAIVPLSGNGQATGAGPVMGALFSLQTGFGVRSKRGRIFIPGTNTGLSTTGTLSSSLTTTANNVINNIKNRYVDGGNNLGPMRLVVWSRKNNDFTSVTNIALRPNFGVQRRRNIGIGM